MRKFLFSICSAAILQGCIGTDVLDDFVEDRVVIENPINSLKVGSTYQFNAIYLNNVGSPENAEFTWQSSDNEILSINADGMATGISKGDVTVMAIANEKMDEIFVEVSDTTVISLDERVAELETSSSYPLSGTAILRKESGKNVLIFDEDFNTTSALPGLYVYLSNNTNSINDALEVGKVENFTGAQRYEMEEDFELSTYNIVLFYCKPFRVPVGHGELKP